MAEVAVFESLESAVRSYCRSWPVVFDRAVGSVMWDEEGNDYLDFFAGAGALNYGHNNPRLKAPLVEYLSDDRVVHSLDMFTVAKREFLETLDELILRPRGYAYRIQFPGPGGTNATEAALKLARKATGRTEIVSFTNSFHGMTLGALSVTGNSQLRRAAGVPLTSATPLPFDGALGERADPFAWFDRLLEDSGSGLDLPAAVIVETVQGEGGVNIADPAWLRDLADRCQRHEIPLILDDVQMGCGRTGPFFSFEIAGIVPDIVCVSKSIGGYGLPLALTLIREDLDVWEPGEHTGTFRGIDPALVTGAAALRCYWSDDQLERQTRERETRVLERLREIASGCEDVSARGRGMVFGLDFGDGERARSVTRAAFDRRLLVERCGPENEVVKLLPALTIDDDELEDGLARLAEAVYASLS